MKKILSIIGIITFLPNTVSAHCPLCTAGAGALAVLAASLGVSAVVVGILIGAFAAALGLWIATAVKKRYIPLQKTILTIVIFLGTIIPIMPLVRAYGPLYIPFIGEYGTTIAVNLYIVGVSIGALIMLIALPISKGITKMRGKQIPFQGIIITVVLLFVSIIITQLLS